MALFHRPLKRFGDVAYLSISIAVVLKWATLPIKIIFKGVIIMKKTDTKANVSTKALDVAKIAMEDAASEYAKGYNSHLKKSELKKLKSNAKDTLDAYNLELEKYTYRIWTRDEENAVKTAIRTRFIPNAKKCKFKTDDNDYMTVQFSTDDSYKVNLPMMQVTIGAEHFANVKWFNMLEKFAYLFATKLNKDITGSDEFTYQIEDASQVFKFEKGLNPLSDEGLITAVQKIIDAILFIKGEDGENIIKLVKKEDELGRAYASACKVITESMTKQGSKVGEVFICDTS